MPAPPWLCPWKGVASYYTVIVDGAQFGDAAWTYHHPSPLVRPIKNHVAFRSGVQIEDDQIDTTGTAG